ncbi:MAG: SIMPL domain-containing protein [Planctomycetota bacterium]
MQPRAIVRSCTSLALAAATLLWPALAAAQLEFSSVSAQGTATITRPADFLRVQVDLTAQDGDAAAAVAKLKELKQAAQAKLTELGALADSVKFGPPVLGGSADPEAEMRQMMMMRMGGETPEKPSGERVRITVQFTADWPLKADTPEDLLLAVHSLEGKIKAAGLAGPQEEEEEEEEEEERPGQRAPGEPTFTYLIKLTPAEQEQALKEAFRKAHARAERLAKVAGLALGRLRRLEGAPDGDSPEYRYFQYAAYGREERSVIDHEVEAAGPRPTKVEQRVMLHLTFELGGA